MSSDTDDVATRLERPLTDDERDAAEDLFRAVASLPAGWADEVASTTIGCNRYEDEHQWGDELWACVREAWELGNGRELEPGNRARTREVERRDCSHDIRRAPGRGVEWCCVCGAFKIEPSDWDHPRVDPRRNEASRLLLAVAGMDRSSVLEAMRTLHAYADASDLEAEAALDAYWRLTNEPP